MLHSVARSAVNRFRRVFDRRSAFAAILYGKGQIEKEGKNSKRCGSLGF